MQLECGVYNPLSVPNRVKIILVRVSAGYNVDGDSWTIIVIPELIYRMAVVIRYVIIFHHYIEHITLHSKK